MTIAAPVDPLILYDGSTSISNICGDWLVSLFTQYCGVVAIGGTQATGDGATVVRQGLLQEDPVKDRISIIVNQGDPEDTNMNPSWRDAIIQDGDWGISPRELGGGERWWRKFTVEIRVYLVKSREDRVGARQIALTVRGRAERALRDNMGVNLTDSFGEHAFLAIIDSSGISQSGGPPNSFIWKETIRVKFLTEK